MSSAIVLRIPYVVSGTDAVEQEEEREAVLLECGHGYNPTPIILRTRYAVSGTDVCYLRY